LLALSPHSDTGIYHKKQRVQFSLLVPDVVSLRPYLGHTGRFRHLTETLLTDVVLLQSVATSDVFPADSWGNPGLFVLEQAIQVLDIVKCVSVLSDALEVVLSNSIVESLLADVISLPGRFNSQIT
jgi:hypothetical protein